MTVKELLDKMQLFSEGFYPYAPANMGEISLEGNQFWVDKDAMSRLNEEDKKAIHKEQKSNRLTLSRFLEHQ